MMPFFETLHPKAAKVPVSKDSSIIRGGLCAKPHSTKQILESEFLKIAIDEGVAWPDGTPRSTDNDFTPQAPIVQNTQAFDALVHAANFDTPQKTKEQSASIKRNNNHKYTVSPKGRARRRTVYALKNELKRKAERVNRNIFSISPTPRADLDRTNQIRGGSSIFRTAA